MRINQKNLLSLLVLLLSLSPSFVQAHTGGNVMSGWSNGFNHPLHGWDHLLTMLAVGVWAAQLGGRAIWQLPLAFVGVMSLGGVFGMTGVSMPGVEMMILLSVIVFGFLVVRRIRFQATVSVLIVVFFAFLSWLRARSGNARFGQSPVICPGLHAGNVTVARCGYPGCAADSTSLCLFSRQQRLRPAIRKHCNRQTKIATEGQGSGGAFRNDCYPTR